MTMQYTIVYLLSVSISIFLGVLRPTNLLMLTRSTRLLVHDEQRYFHHFQPPATVLAALATRTRRYYDSTTTSY